MTKRLIGLYKKEHAWYTSDKTFHFNKFGINFEVVKATKYGEIITINDIDLLLVVSDDCVVSPNTLVWNQRGMIDRTVDKLMGLFE